MSETRTRSRGFLFTALLTGLLLAVPVSAQSITWDLSKPVVTDPCHAGRSGIALRNLVAGPNEALHNYGSRGVQVSSDYGTSWQETGVSFRQVQNVLPLSDGSLLVGAYSEEGGVFKARDHARRLEQTGLTKRVLSIAATDDGSRIYAVTNEVRLLVSNDDGDSWSPVNPEWYVSVVRTGPNGSVYVKSGYGYYTSENGDFWRFVYSDRFPYPTHERGKLLSVEDAGVEFSYDDGKSWRRVLEEPNARLLTSRDGNIFVVARSGALYRSTNSGETWRRLTAPFSDVCTTASTAVIDGSGTSSHSRRVKSMRVEEWCCFADLRGSPAQSWRPSGSVVRFSRRVR